MLWILIAQGRMTKQYALLNLSPNDYSLQSKCAKFRIGPWETRMHQCDPPYNVSVFEQNRTVFIDRNYSVLAVQSQELPDRFNCDLLGQTCQMLQAGILPTSSGQSLLSIVRVYGQRSFYHFHRLPINQTRFDQPNQENRVVVPGEERLGGLLHFQACGHKSGQAALIAINYTASRTLQILFSRSTDFGSSWSPLQVLYQTETLNYNNRILSVADSGRLFIAQSFFQQPFQLKYSDDFGLTWATSSLSLNNGSHIVSEIASLDSKTLAISQLQYTSEGRQIRVALSPDNGKSWSAWQPTSITYKNISQHLAESISLKHVGNALYYMYQNQQAQLVLAKAELRSVSNATSLVNFSVPGAFNCGTVVVNPLQQLGDSRLFFQFDCYPRNGVQNSVSFIVLDLNPVAITFDQY